MRGVRSGVALAEALVALLVLAVAGMLVYDSAVRGVQESAWTSERVLAESLCDEMLQFYGSLDACTLAQRPEVAASEAASGPGHAKALAEVALLGPEPPGEEPSPQVDGDVLARAQRELIAVLKLERIVVLDGAERRTLRCLVRWTSRAGQRVTVERRKLLSSGCD